MLNGIHQGDISENSIVDTSAMRTNDFKNYFEYDFKLKKSIC